MDENEFFRQATIQLCGTLDIEKAVDRCRRYFSGFFPVTRMDLHLFEPGFRAMRIIAQSTLYEHERFVRIVPLPKQVRSQIQKELLKRQDVFIVNEPDENPVSSYMMQWTKKPDVSHMIMLLEVEGNRLGVLAISSDGKSRYTKSHAHLLSLVHDPFAIAMSNALRYQEVIELKDMLADDNRYLHQELLRISGDEIIGKDGGLKRVMEMVRQVASLNSPVLLMGETGVGKEVIANAIHYSSHRKDGPFIKVNCGSIPETLLDSELFGHEKGAFTGAITQRRGRFERAHGGTIFLDEIGELPLAAQIRLLRVLQDKEIERVGGTKSVPVDIRIITATHQELEKMIESNQFREDLWFRINVFPIEIPPLRQRKEDVHALVHYFVDRKSRELKIYPPPKPADGAVDLLKSYHWPGNVRELENIIERGLIRSRGQKEGEPLTFENLDLPKAKDESMPVPVFSDPNHKVLGLDEAMSVHIRHALKLAKGKVEGPDGAAELLKINPHTLRGRMQKLEVPYGRKK
jgi:transcriptional regulator with GAF, ATPase, and Fis domain